MLRFLVDEDVPRSTAPLLREHGYIVEDVRDVGLRGRSDRDVFAYAQEVQAALITCDKGFASLRRFPLGTHAGIIVVRIPDEVPPTGLNAELLRALAVLRNRPLAGSLVIVETGRVRVRRHPSPP